MLSFSFKIWDRFVIHDELIPSIFVFYEKNMMYFMYLLLSSV